MSGKSKKEILGMKVAGKEPEFLPKVVEAIESLNEPGGSTQKAILRFVIAIDLQLTSTV